MDRHAPLPYQNVRMVADSAEGFITRIEVEFIQGDGGYQEVKTYHLEMADGQVRQATASDFVDSGTSRARYLWGQHVIISPVDRSTSTVRQLAGTVAPVAGIAYRPDTKKWSYAVSIAPTDVWCFDEDELQPAQETLSPSS